MLKNTSILRDIKKVHLIGIKGRGISSLANILCDLNIEVTGSDIADTFLTDKILSKLPVKIFAGFDKNNINSDVDLVISSVVYYDYRSQLPLLNNPEVDYSLKNRFNLLAYPQFIGKLFQESRGIAISGTHGKTTTTALTGLIFEKAGLEATTICGGEVIAWQNSSKAGKGEYFILEADEYRESFLNYYPEILVVGAINYDHPDYFKTFADYLCAYSKLARQVKTQGKIYVLGDNQHSLKAVESIRDNQIITYGLKNNQNLTISTRKIINGFQYFSVSYHGKSVGNFYLPLPGTGHLVNALVAIGLSLDQGISVNTISAALKEFKGTRRRFEIKRTSPYIVIDDYAGLPREIETTLIGAREFYPLNTIWAVFQPHTYSRTEALLSEFALALSLADKVLIMDIYAPPREKEGKIHSLDLVKLLGNKAIYTQTQEKTIEYLKSNLKAKDVVITMGIGEVWPVAEALSLNNSCI